MPIQIKLSQLVSEDKDRNLLTINALKAILQKEITLSNGINLKKLIKQIEPLVDDFRDLRLKLVKENSTEKKDDNGNFVGFDILPDKLDFVNSEILKAVEMDIELCIDKFNILDFENIKLIGEHIMFIDWLFH